MNTGIYYITNYQSWAIAINGRYICKVSEFFTVFLLYVALGLVISQSYELHKAQTVNQIFKTWFDTNKGTNLNLDLMYKSWTNQP